MELIWCPYAGEAHIVAGYVHPPTEGMFQTAFATRGTRNFTTVKGLEGSCDLPRDRTAIIGLSTANPDKPIERLQLVPRDYAMTTKNVALESTPQLLDAMHSVLRGEASELMQTALWNGGFYLWRSGVCSDLESGIAKAESLLTSGVVAQQLQNTIQAVATITRSLVKQ